MFRIELGLRGVGDRELVAIDGSFELGVDAAKAGIVMLASPQVGMIYRQEFSLGEQKGPNEGFLRSISAAQDRRLHLQS